MSSVKEIGDEHQQFLTIAAYKIGFAMLCGYPPKRHTDALQAAELFKHTAANKTVLVL